MNIGFLTHTASHYGANRSLSALIDGFLPLHNRLYLITPEEGQITRNLREKGVTIAVIPQVRAFRSLRHSGGTPQEGQNVRTANQHGIAEQLKEWRVQLIYSNSAMVSAGADAARILDLPHVWHLREFGDLDYHREPPAGWSKERINIRQSDATISVSNAVRRHFFSAHRAGRDFVVDNGILPRDIFRRLRQHRKQRTRNLSSSAPFKFILVGRIRPGKGQATAIRAFSSLVRKFPSARLVVVGGGDIKNLRILASRLNVTEKVAFKGYLQNPVAEMLDADVALMCSPNEAFGRVTAEAMATGLPVIGHNAGGTPELIEDGTNGLLYTGEVESLAFCMAQLASAPTCSRELGMSGWEIAQRRFSIEQYVSTVWNIVQKSHGGIRPNLAE